MPTYIAGISCLVLASLALALAPHRLVVVELEQSHPLHVELGLASILSLVGSLLFYFLLYRSGADTALRSFVESIVLMTIFAIMYFDMRFLIIPDLYVIVLLAASFIGPLAGPWRSALFGGGLCASLVGGVALLWRWRTGTDGMGFGDVKLAAALGALLGMDRGLWTVSGAACGGAIVGLLDQMRCKRRAIAVVETPPQPHVVPFGAALAAVGGVILLFTAR